MSKPAEGGGIDIDAVLDATGGVLSAVGMILAVAASFTPVGWVTLAGLAVGIASTAISCRKGIDFNCGVSIFTTSVGGVGVGAKGMHAVTGMWGWEAGAGFADGIGFAGAGYDAVVTTGQHIAGR
ncbi:MULTISPECIES: hypothetical protein [unclassified Rathayibacter]|uniref:hypothetical protein n=1 Tax=unclassified Rathayibacter TaxID=2609250 RepID=UPI00188BE059|nr:MULTISPECIES: hypothetical protein [unclassified Rathayibacter]MBF4463008.1 hypothetical protein [Rathayibacter sp. VKM Ac-2879]MBF4504422.1 hypothetical protein [Rathayibacter sp. VKM Ac-2878]